MSELTWLGHASVLVEMDGVRLLTDPVLRERVAHLRRHVPPAAAPDRLDAVLLSHLHRDHLDLPSMRLLRGSGPLVVPRGAAKSVQRLKRETVELAAGDTERFDAMAELAPIDVALMPIWGWGPSLGPGHMDPEQAAEAVALIRPAVAVPIHWGTYLPITLGQRRGDLLVDPPHRFAARCAELAPDTRVSVLSPGETMILPG